ncbi:receptor-interacting serine/threonine-protein kinase 3-like [Sebastes fasciatus]|uniref:receptor-interacting serine/threonine-protein kinase 3-like n=1 Tax=Sebastes fasciatus TaxID=394691 RepID=UPI003D9DF6BF
MALLSHKTIGDENLERWEPVDSGGFGHVYKARHKDWGFDVAIKILRDGVCPFMPLRDEAKYMGMASCEFVLRLHGTYQGCPPFGRTSTMQQGLVMEFMERGSVQSLRDLSGPPPWPLIFRLAHQVAVGMNFLHLQGLMHHDLKPNNVLLNNDLNAKLADFGLSRVSTSALKSKRVTTDQEQIGGSYKYMPPEAFEASYEPRRAFDVYSYGILLWSIITGKEPYPVADYSRVELRIPLGDRPTCQDIEQMKADGLEELVDLMKTCWDGCPYNRPVFKQCVEVTEGVFSKHRGQIHKAVVEVLARLESPTSNQSRTYEALNDPLQTPEEPMPMDTVDFVKTERPSLKAPDSISTKRMTNTDKAKFVDDNKAKLIRYVTEVMAITEELGDMVHSEACSRIDAKATSMDKMRELFRTLHAGGPRVKAAFYDALEEHQSDLLERLSG